MIEFQFKLNEICGELTVTSQSASQEISEYYTTGDFDALIDSLISMAIWNNVSKLSKEELKSTPYSPKAYAEFNGITDIYISVNDSPLKKLF